MRTMNSAAIADMLLTIRVANAIASFRALDAHAIADVLEREFTEPLKRLRAHERTMV